MKHRYTICPHCGCGCGLYLVEQDGAIGGVTASATHPFSSGQLCARGWTCHQLLDAGTRIDAPLLRSGAVLAPASWDQALGHAAKRLQAVRDKHGPGSIGVIASPRLTTGELLALRAFARGVLRTPHCDSAARLSGGAVSFPRAARFADLEHSDLIVVIGANPIEDNPVLGARIMALCKPRQDRPYASPDLSHTVAGDPVPLAVVCSRRSALSALAQPAIKPRPGSELPVLAALLKLLVENHHLACDDPAFAKLKENLAKHTVASLLNGTAVTAQSVELLARRLAGARSAVLVTGREIAQAPAAGSGTAALANLALLMGERLAWLPAAAAANERDALRILTASGGMSYLEMIDALRGRKLRALVLAGEDPLRTLPGRDEVAAALGKAEFVLAIDAWSGPSHDHAGVVLPLALSLEQEGSFRSLDGTEQPFARAARPAGSSQPLDAIMAKLAAQLRTRLEIDRTVVADQPPGIDPLKTVAVPAAGDAIMLELGSAYPHLAGGEALTMNTPHLAREFSGGYIELHPEDIARLGVRTGWKVKVTSAAAAIQVPVQANEAVLKGTAFMPLHFGGNALAPFAYDARLKTPVLRGIPVTVEKT
ncbi:MAG TPA: molybdopterin-dependent oxidoreductase [Candidatus Edwardsbacteria bacterium]|nr:molybdopterin-dependent oxidoreductase [Candidatus Edwardsbacteria bacterium]